MGAAFSALSFDVGNIQSLGWLVPCLCAITVNNIKRTTIIWQSTKWCSETKVSQQLSGRGGETAPHVRCKATLEMHVFSRKKKNKTQKKAHVCVCGDWVGSRTVRWCGRPRGEKGKEKGRMQKRAKDFCELFGRCWSRWNAECLHSSYFNILRKHGESGSKLLLSSPPLLPQPLL